MTSAYAVQLSSMRSKASNKQKQQKQKNSDRKFKNNIQENHREELYISDTD